MQTAKTMLGLAAEGIVCSWLECQGFRILDRNWRKPWGELDIVADKQGIVHFVEVKASARQQAGFDPFLRADGWKMHKVQRTAETWLVSHHYGSNTEWQLDVASVIMEGKEPEIELFENI